MAKKNAFDELLESVAEENDRKALGDIAEKYPQLREGVLRQSDYSRKMDELRAKSEELKKDLEETETWRKWASENYVYDAYGEGQGATKRELEKDRLFREAQERAAALEQQVNAGGEMNLTEIERALAEKGFMTKSQFEEQAKLYQDAQAAQTRALEHIALNLPSLAFKHGKEFGEELSGTELLEFTNKKNFRDLDTAYNEFVRGKREERAAKEHEEAMKQAYERGKEEALKERGMSPNSMPVDSGESEVGPLLAFVRKGPGQAGADAPPVGNFGHGELAAYAARTMDRA
jgi:hypothetical protein